jgi:uncharacterized protein YidB (DUF937 family)
MTVSIPSTATSGVATPGTHHGRGGFEKTLSAVADKLGISTGDLKKQLQSGQSLTDIAAAKGLDKDDLVSTIASTLPSAGPDGAQLDTTAMATRIADRTHQTPPSSRPSSSDGESELGKGLDALSSALGINTDELLQRLTDGTGISDLLSANPDVSSQLSQLQNKGALVDGYA